MNKFSDSRMKEHVKMSENDICACLCIFHITDPGKTITLNVNLSLHAVDVVTGSVDFSIWLKTPHTPTCAKKTRQTHINYTVYKRHK